MGNTCKSSEIENLEITTESRKESLAESNDDSKEFEEIKEIRKQVAMMNVFKRKDIAKEEYLIYKKQNGKNDKIKYIDKEQIKNKYIKIMRLLLIDNTNKDIVKEYLNFIKNYPDFIKENGLNSYEKEINKYKKIFTVKEMEEIDRAIKNKSQKTIFLDFLNFISSKTENNNISAKCKFIKDLSNKRFKDLFLFNTPIEFDNEELLYYKYYYDILFEISQQDDDEIEYFLNGRKKVIEYIIKHDLYNNGQIISNEDKMNLLFIYLTKEKFKISFKEGDSINFNRLMQKKPVTKEDFECIQNLVNRKLLNKKNLIYFYTLDELMINNEISPYIKDIKNFLLRIIDSNAYQQAIKKLFPEYYQSLNSNENENIKQFIKERIKFYPFQDLDLSGITDKLSCYSFIPTINFEVEDKEYFRIEDKNMDTYKIGLTIDNSLHEINHANQMIIFFKGNNKDLINSPERNNIKENENISEGGISLEYLLFGRIIRKMNLFECLYVMNEKNYEQDLDQFRNNFINIVDLVKKSKENTEYIKIENGIFKRFYDNSISEIKDIIDLLSTKDSTKDNFDISLPRMFIGKYNKSQENEKDIHQKKCMLYGGWKKIN